MNLKSFYVEYLNYHRLIKKVHRYIRSDEFWKKVGWVGNFIICSHKICLHNYCMWWISTEFQEMVEIKRVYFMLLNVFFLSIANWWVNLEPRVSKNYPNSLSLQNDTVELICHKFDFHIFQLSHTLPSHQINYLPIQGTIKYQHGMVSMKEIVSAIFGSIHFAVNKILSNL